MLREGTESTTVRRAVVEAKAGSVDAFEPLVRENASRVIRLCYHFLGDWDEARDLAQETFARAYLCLSRYDPARPFSAWICTIAARLSTDRLRHLKVLRRVNAGMSGRNTAGGLDAETSLSLKEALGRLTPRQRQAVVLCDLHGFSATEAAEILGCSASTVRVLRFLARGRLRALVCPPSGTIGQAEMAADALTADSIAAERFK